MSWDYFWSTIFVKSYIFKESLTKKPRQKVRFFTHFLTLCRICCTFLLFSIKWATLHFQWPSGCHGDTFQLPTINCDYWRRHRRCSSYTLYIGDAWSIDIIYHVSALVICQIYIMKVSQQLLLFTNEVSENS